MNQASETLFEILQGTVRLHPEKIALASPERLPLSFSELWSLIEYVGQFLSDKGFSTNSRIVSVLPNCHEAATLFLSVVPFCSFVPLNPNYQAEEFQIYLKKIKPAAIIAHSDFASHARTVARQLDIPIFEIKPDINQGTGYFHFEHKISAYPLAYKLASLSDVALYLQTSGSIGTPKFVPITHGALHSFCSSRPIRLAQIRMNVLPLFHLQGLLSILMPVVFGGCCVHAPNFTPSAFIDWLDEYDPSSYSLTPVMHIAVYEELKKRPNFIKNPSLEMISTSSAPLSQDYIVALEKLMGVTMRQSYAMTETLGITADPAPPTMRKPGSVGLPLQVEITIVDEELNRLAANQVGEIVVKSPWVMSGYFEDPEANAAAFCTQGFRTGDLGYLDADGYLFLTGRTKEIIIRGGEKISPKEIDDVLLRHPQIKSAVTFPTSHCTLGQDIVAAVVLEESATLNEKALRQYAYQHLATFKVPYRILFVSEIPRGPTGKLQRHKLAEYFHLELAVSLEGQTQQFLTPPPLKDIERQLVALWSEVLKPTNTIGIHDNFFDLGGNSLASIQLVSAIEQHFKCQLSIASLFQWSTIAKLASFLEELLIQLEDKTRSVLPTYRGALDYSVYHQLLALALGKAAPRLTQDSLITQYRIINDKPILYLVGGAQELAAYDANFSLCGMHSAFGFMKFNEENVRDLSKHYVNEILRHDPLGPYFIGGYCSGGLIAHEMAQQLKVAGKKIELLLLIDQIIYRPYNGKIAFFFLQDSNVLQDLQQPGSDKILGKLFPLGWTTDIIPGKHSPTLSATSSMVLSERISARLLLKSQYPALPPDAYKVEWQLVNLEQDHSKVTVSFNIINLGTKNFPADRLCLGHHWLDQNQVLVAWGEQQIPLTQTIAFGQSQAFQYTLENFKETGVFKLVIDILDTSNTWFSLMGAASLIVSVENNALHTPAKLNIAELFKLQREGKLQTVIPLYQQAIQSDQTLYPRVLPKLVEAMMQLGRSKAAKIELEKGIDYITHPEAKLQCQILLSVLYYELNSYKQAIIEAEQVLKLDGSNCQALMILGLCKAQFADFIAAQAAVDAALELFVDQSLPNYMVKHLDQFNEILDKAQNQRVLKYAAILTERDSLNPAHFDRHGYYFSRQLDFTQAEKLLLAAIEIYPHASVFYKNLASLSLRQNKLLEAENACRILLKLSPLKIQNYLLYARVLSKQQNYRASKKILNQARKIDPTNVDLINWVV